MTQSETDKEFMAIALDMARLALKRKEVPIGAVVVMGGRVVGRGYNLKESLSDPTAHAEIIAIKEASETGKCWRLTSSTLYVTLEPCLMCMGAIIQARIERLVFAAFDPKAGACGSLYDVSDDHRLNHSVRVATGICKDESSALLKGFFSALRARGRANKAL